MSKLWLLERVKKDESTDRKHFVFLKKEDALSYFFDLLQNIGYYDQTVINAYYKLELNGFYSDDDNPSGCVEWFLQEIEPLSK